ncbi:MAG: GntR family transcriptional regulator [Planctomyces sp.]|jgi:DNA-binding LacI/PurR family transcriptional regulator
MTGKPLVCTGFRQTAKHMQKHQRISQELRTEIATGKFGPIGKLPSESQLVERFRVSRPTVARALRDLQSEGLIDRKAGSGSFVRHAGSQPHNQLISLLVPGRGATEVLDVVCGELGAIAKLHGYGVLWGRSPHPMLDRNLNSTLALEACEEFIKRGVRGVIFAPFEHLDDSRSVNLQLLDLLRHAGIAVVLIDRDFMPFPLRSDYDLVALDNVQAGFLAADHLLRLGMRRLRLLSDRDSASSVDARLTGVREAMLQYQLHGDMPIRMDGDASCLPFVKHAIEDVDAIVCANDFTAFRLQQSLIKLNVRVPEDLRLIGFDDVRHATLANVALTTVRQPCRELAWCAFRTLEERILHAAHPVRTTFLAPTLVVRNSCGAYVNNTYSERKACH